MLLNMVFIRADAMAQSLAICGQHRLCGLFVGEKNVGLILVSIQ